MLFKKHRQNSSSMFRTNSRKSSLGNRLSQNNQKPNYNLENGSFQMNTKSNLPSSSNLQKPLKAQESQIQKQSLMNLSQENGETLGDTVQKLRNFYSSIKQERGEKELQKIFSTQLESSQKLPPEERGILGAIIGQM